MADQKEMILIVEDDSLLREFFEEVYRKIFGDEYEIKIEVNCEEAIPTFGANKERIIMIQSDFNLSQAKGIMNGIEFLKYAREQEFRGIIVLASGDIFEGELLEIILHKGIIHLMKPITYSDLAPLARILKESRK